MSEAQKVALHNATTGERMSREVLEARANRIANLLRTKGLKTGDHIAIWMRNSFDFFAVVRGAMRIGLYITPISTHLNPEETQYIVEDCGARCLIGDSALLENCPSERFSRAPLLYVIGANVAGYERLEEIISTVSDAVPDAPVHGAFMFYSSGTTGRPKGIKASLPTQDFSETPPSVAATGGGFGMGPATIYLNPAPLYHAAPATFSTSVIELGGTVVFLEKFDAELTLKAIDQYKITHAQFVPTMFVRMLKLPEAVRTQYDVSSLALVIHAAAPCPVDVKHRMIEWFGPVIVEYYSGSEAIGSTVISSEEWLKYPGSVGRAVLGELHILGDDGEELPTGEIGMVYFGNGPQFEYHNAKEKTAGAYSKQGWATLGDVGYVNEDGYLYLADRKDFMILSGGVNIYPQEIEDLLTMHPDIHDVAVIGVPNEDFGEEVKAVVQLNNHDAASSDLAEQIIEHCRQHLSTVKCPRSVDFVETLPRTETGKLQKKKVRDPYWGRDT